MWDEKSDLERWRRERICEQMGFVQVKGIVVSCLRWVFWFLGLLDRFVTVGIYIEVFVVNFPELGHGFWTIV